MTKWKLLKQLNKADVFTLLNGGGSHVITNGIGNFETGDTIRVVTKRDKAGNIIEMKFEKEIIE